MWKFFLLGVLSTAQDFIKYPDSVFIGCNPQEITTLRLQTSCLEECRTDPECLGVSSFPYRCNIYKCSDAVLRSTRVERNIDSFVKVKTPTENPSIPADNCSDSFWSKFQGAKISAFGPVTTNSEICEIVQAFPGTSVKVENDFPCGLETCLKWCEVNTACLIAMFKPGTCSLLASPQLTDTTPEVFETWHLDNWQVYQKYPNFKLPYYSQQCAEYPRSACHGNCGWGMGKPGFNRPIYGGFEGQWCGRIKC